MSHAGSNPWPWDEVPSALQDSPAHDKLPLQMTGALSALIFAINGCIEVFFAQGQQSSHLVLLLLLQMVLAGWALAESALVHMPENPAPLRRLRLVLAAQLAMEGSRCILLVSLTPAQMGGTFASRLLDSGVGLLFVALYFIAFLAVNRALIKLYSSNERRVHDRLRLAEVDKMQLAMASEKRLAALKAQLEDAIGSMSQGIVMVASDGRVVLSNAQVDEILELPQGVLGHQQPFAQMLQFKRQRGDTILDSNVAVLAIGEPHQFCTLR